MRHRVALVIAIAAMACGGQPAPPGASPSPAGAVASSAAPTSAGSAATAEARTYDIRGRVVSLDHTRMTVTLDHEAIPGFMDAMKMEYKVAPHTLLDGLTPGAAVQGRLEARGSDYTIVALTKR